MNLLSDLVGWRCRATLKSGLRSRTALPREEQGSRPRFESMPQAISLTMRCLLLIFLLMLSATSEAAIIRVDNRPGRPADFPDLAAAISKAQAGDTIYIAGSDISYESVVLTKRLNLIGPGYFLGQAFPQSRTESLSATMVDVRISPTAAGSHLSGLDVSSNIRVQADDCIVQRCRAGTVILGDNSSSAPDFALRSSIHQCILFRVQVVRARDFLVSNCILQKNGGIHADSATGSIGTFFQNTIIGGESFWWRSRFEFRLENNIVFMNLESDLNILKSNTNFQISKNNFLSHLKASEFLSSSLFIRKGAEDAQWQLTLNADNPARGKGAFGEDLGAFGGATPYVLSGIPAVPYFEVFQAQSTVGPKGKLNVRLKVLGGE